MDNMKKQRVGGLEVFTSESSGSAYGAIIGGREEQQDFCGIYEINEANNEAKELLLLADGMGGHAGGQVAANLAISIFSEAFLKAANLSAKQRLHNALLSANDALKSRIANESDLQGMGCTLVAVIVSNGSIHWISVGDSHLMVFRDGKLEKLNADHSMAPQIDKRVEDGELSAEQAQQHPDRNVLISALTGNRIGLIDQGNSELNDDEFVMLASDGLDTLLNDDILLTLASGKKPPSLVSNLLAKVNEKKLPHQDNTSIVICSGSNQSAGMNQNRFLSSWAILAFAMLGVAIMASALIWVFISSKVTQTSPHGHPEPRLPAVVDGVSDSQPVPTEQTVSDQLSTEKVPIDKQAIDDAIQQFERESQSRSSAKKPKKQKSRPVQKPSDPRKQLPTDTIPPEKTKSESEQNGSEAQNEVEEKTKDNPRRVSTDKIVGPID